MTVVERWTWDDEAKAGYVHINTGLLSDRTVDLGHGLLVDLDPYGRIVGVQVLNAHDPQDMIGRLAALLEHCRIDN